MAHVPPFTFVAVELGYAAILANLRPLGVVLLAALQLRFLAAVMAFQGNHLDNTKHRHGI